MPLHTAIRYLNLPSNHANPHYWRQILEHYPGALWHQNSDHLYPFMIAANVSFLSVTYELLLAAPDVLVSLCCTFN